MTNKQCANSHNCAKQHQNKHALYWPIHIILFICYLFLAYWLLVAQFLKTSQNAYVSGHLINVMPLMQGQVTRLFVKNHDLIIKGQPIATINETSAYNALKAAEAHLATAIQQVGDMQHTTNQIQLRANNELTTAQNNLNQAQEKYRQLLTTYANDANSYEQLKLAQLAVEKATSALTDAQSQNEAALSLPTNTDLYAEPLVLEAMDQLRTAYINWLQSTIHAPETGYIIKRNIKVGSNVTFNTVLMTLVPLNEIWVTAKLKPNDLNIIQDGQAVKLIANINGRHVIYHGQVSGADANDTTTTQHIRIAIDAQQFAQHPLPLGTALNAIINTRQRNNHYLTPIINTPDLAEAQDYREQLVAANQLIDQIVRDHTADTPAPATQLGKL